MTKSIKPGAARPESVAKDRNFRVAIAQFAPIYLDKVASLAKAIRLVRDPRKRGAEVVAFGETWLPGYPAWLDVSPNVALWDHVPTKRVFARLRENSVTVPGPEISAKSIRRS